MSVNSFAPPPMDDEPKKFNTNTDATFSDDYNPLDEAVNEKPYSQPNFSASGDTLNQSIPEPTYTPPPIGKENAYKDINKENAGAGGFSSGQTVNPSLNEVPNEDKKMAAKHLTNLIMDAYEQIHVFANYSLKFPERKINKLVQDGEIDLNAPIVYDYGSTITGGDFIKEFNDQTKDTLKVTDEFKKDVKPVLQRVLEKRGAGLTDEQYLIYAFGKDAALKGVTFFQIKQQMKDVIETMKEHTQAYREATAAAQQGAYTPPPTTPPPPPRRERPAQNDTYSNETYSSGYSEPEETIIPPDFGNPDSLDLMKKGEEDAKKSRKRTHKVRENHFSGKKRGRKKKDDDISDAIIIDEDNPLD
jgi:hypothetical protein